MAHRPTARNARRPSSPRTTTAVPLRATLIPLGALAAGFGLTADLHAQTAAPTPAAAASAATTSARLPDHPLAPVKVNGLMERDGYQATATTVGKGEQALKDVPQSVTVITEKLIDDKNLDTLKAVMHSVTGVAFEAGEGGAIGDLIRLRGFSTRGDIFQDGMRDNAQYNRDTFNQERIEVLRGSASMLYGRGSTGGIINQVSKQPFLLDEHLVDFTAGTDAYYRLTGDFNLKTSDTAALRMNVMTTDADSFRNGPETHRKGIAPTYRFGIGTSDQFTLAYYHLDYQDVPDYGFGWVNYRPLTQATTRWYGFASDDQNDAANQLTLTHLHRFDEGSTLKSSVRLGRYTRDLWATTARLQPANADSPTSCTTRFVDGSTTQRQIATYGDISDASVICRGSQTRAAEDQNVYAQSDYSGSLTAFGLANSLLAGAEFAHEDSTSYSYTFPFASGSNTARINPKVNTTWGQVGPDPALADSRIKSLNTEFTAKTMSAYAQDTVQIAPTVKLLAGLRFDRFSGDYQRTAGPLSRTDTMWSYRSGALWQPDVESTYYASWGTSFNPSGDLYQFDALSANTPPEKSRNIEAGAKWELLQGDLFLRTAVFRTEKYNERNTDVFQGADEYLLSGKRHVDGIEFEAAGRPLPNVEVFGGVAYMRGKIDAPGSSANAAATVGKDSGLTPRRTGNIWVTYEFSDHWRAGIGADGMSSRLPALAEADDASGRVNMAPGYVKADAMLEYRTGRYRVKLNVFNLFDALYADGLYRGFTLPGPTRSAQLTVSAKF